MNAVGEVSVREEVVRIEFDIHKLKLQFQPYF